jgi:hypothetical protein
MNSITSQLYLILFERFINRLKSHGQRQRQFLQIIFVKEHQALWTSEDKYIKVYYFHCLC